MRAKQKLISQEESEKKIVIENLRNETRKRGGVFVGTAILFLAIKLFLKPFPYYYHALAVCFFLLSLIFPALKYIEKHSSLSLQQIQRLLVVISIFEMFCILFMLYLFLPIGIYYIREVVLIITLSLSVFFVMTYPVIRSEKYNNLFLALCFLALVLVGMIEYKRLFPIYDNYPITEDMISSPFMILGSVLVGGAFLFVMGDKLNYYWEMLTKGNLELRKLNIGLEERVRGRTKELEGAKINLEDKVQERTRELEKERVSLDKKVKERTKELEESQIELEKRIKELEGFQKISVGRELKMIELKKEIERLKETNQE